jgi:hypothetical protein
VTVDLVVSDTTACRAAWWRSDEGEHWHACTGRHVRAEWCECWCGSRRRVTPLRQEPTP